jgi:acyl carrier protein
MLEQIIDIISKQLKADPAEITPATNIMEDLGADSLDIVELLMAVEENFGVSVPDEDVPGLKTVQDIASYIESNKQ